MKQDKQYWIKLSVKYFDAKTTEREEAQLREFVATNEDPDFDELRAVMGFAALGRRMERDAKAQQNKRTAILPYWRIAGMAASILLVVGLFAHRSESLVEPDCVAYVNGQIVTNPDQVMELMQHTMQDLTTDFTQADPIESQLREMFETL